jgi:dTDP-4-amino-4,6-dideoxygalactose transaminase
MPGPGHLFLGDEERKLLGIALAEWQLSRYRYDAREGEEPTFVWTFEREVERLFNIPHCIAVNSGTSALLCALAGLGVGPGDEVIVPGYTFIATIAAVVHRGAVPVLAEIDASLTLDPDDVAAKITSRTKAILPVHMLGAPSDMGALRTLAETHGLLLIEDVAQACGGAYQGGRLGTWGDAGAFSLNTFKIITAGEGGFMTCASDAVHERAYAFHDHGFRPFRLGVVDSDAMFGLNLRMSELTGAIALAQLRKLDDVLAILRAKKAALTEAIGEQAGVQRRPLHDDRGECASLLVVQFRDAAFAAAVADELGTVPLSKSGRHVYSNMPQLLSRRMVTPTSCPFNCEAHPTTRMYQPGMLPRTDDVLSRSVALSVGVVDTYLGSGFGVNPRSTADEIESVGERFRSVVEDVARR